MKRRQFLRNTALGVTSVGVLKQGVFSEEKQNQQYSPLKIKSHRKLGRTNFMASDISSGGNPQSAVLQSVLEAGVNYIDTAESYGRGQAENTIGKVIKNFQRKSLFITSKLHLKGDENKASILSRARKCLERLQTDYLDCMMLHSCASVKLINYKPFHEAMKQLKTEGKLRFVGISNHGPRGDEQDSMEKVLLAAIADGRFDVLLLVYNFIQKEMGENVLKAAAQKNIGTTLMKTKPVDRYLIAKKEAEENGKISERGKKRLEKLKEVADQAEGFIKKHNLKSPTEIRDAAVRFVLANSNVNTVCINFRSFDDLDPYLKLSGSTLTKVDKQKLSLYLENCSQFYCRHACGLCESSCPNGVPVGTIMRYNHYFVSQGREKEAMEKYASLNTAKANICENCKGHCEISCPYNVHIAPQLTMAHHNLALV